MIRSTTLFFWFGLIITASIGLYRTSDRVQDLDRKLRDINVSIESEQRSIHVLKAEWVYLANPARIEVVSKKHLSLRPTAPQQIETLDMLSDILPTRSEAMGSVAVTGSPIANIRTSLAVMPPHPLLVRTAFVVKHKPSLSSVAVASIEPSNLNDHMMMEHTASAQPLPQSISSLIDRLDTHP